MDFLSKNSSAGRKRLWTGLAALGLLGLAVIMQWQTGAYRSEFGAHSDEPAHVVTGLMVRDYLADGLLSGTSPLAFANAYYDRYPKVAIGHYPPAFYLVEGLWLLPVRSPGAVLVLMALLCSVATLLTWHSARNHGLSGKLALWPATLFFVHPLVSTYTSIVMSDLLLVIFCLLAIEAWRKFLGSSKARHSLWFGLWAAAAILTKGSGLFLALLPPLSIALTGKWQLLKCRALWLAAVPVLFLAAPWMVATQHITAEGMSSIPLSEYVPTALAFFVQQLPREFGWLVCGVALITIIRGVVQVFTRRSLDDSSACHIATVLGLITLYLVVPAGLDGRYFLPLVASLYALCFGLVSSVVEHRFSKTAQSPAIIVTLFALAAFYEAKRPVVKHLVGYAPVIDAIVAETEMPGEGEFIDVLIASGSNGEGAVVAAAAFRPEAPLKIHRSSKLLVETDWMGRNARPFSRPGAETWQRLSELGIDWILVDDDSTLPQVTLLIESLPEQARKDAITYEIEGKSEQKTKLLRLKIPR